MKQKLADAFAKLEAEKKAGTRPPMGELEFRGLLVQAEEEFMKVSYSVGHEPEDLKEGVTETLLDAARKLNKARHAWLVAKGAIPR